MKHTATELRQKQSLPLEAKIQMTKNRIQQWIDYWDSDVYVAFSGGLDSTVLLDIVWSIDPAIPAVFSDTGLEFPEIKDFVRSYGDKVTWIKPKLSFRKVIEKYGYPILSKDNAEKLQQLREHKSQKTINRRLYGDEKGNGMLPKKWHYLRYAPFKISHKCCDALKKNPFKIYEKKTGLKPIVGTMTGESMNRHTYYLKSGCNVIDTKRPKSMPMSFWLKKDVYEYIRTRKLPIAEVYNMGYDRTGCMFCMFGVHLEKGENRFQKMHRTHPKQYDFCFNTLGLGKVLDAINVEY